MGIFPTAIEVSGGSRGETVAEQLWHLGRDAEGFSRLLAKIPLDDTAVMGTHVHGLTEIVT